jgi:alpha-mannosidase
MPLMHSSTPPASTLAAGMAEDFYRPLGEIALEAIPPWTISPRRTPPADLSAGPRRNRLGHTWEYMWVRGEVVLPQEARDRPWCSPGYGGRATLFVNGEPFGTRRAEWVNVPHHYLSDKRAHAKGRSRGALRPAL